MFWSTNTAHPTESGTSSLISALDGLVAFATLEQYGVVDGRDTPTRDRAADRARRARRRAVMRSDCLNERSLDSAPRERRAASLAGPR